MPEMKAHAKINLFLSVRGKDERGYHPLKTVFQPIDLHDKVIVEEIQTAGILLSCNNHDVPKDKRNTAYKAAELMAKEAGKDLSSSGIKIAIEKHIPLSSGLGGSAVDAAPVIRMLNDMWGMGLTLERMEEIGAGIGADVPQAMIGRTCYAEGYGDKIVDEFSLKPVHICIAIPGVYMSNMDGRKTTFLYDRIDSIRSGPAADEGRMRAALTAHSWERIAQEMHNDFETVAFHFHPELRRVKERMMESNALGAMLSGSGGAVFGLFKETKDAHCAVERMLSKNGIRMIFQTHTI